MTRAIRYFDLNESIYLRKFSEIIQKELLKICYRTVDIGIKKITGIRTHELCLFLHPTFSLLFCWKLGWVRFLKFPKEETLDYLEVAIGGSHL